MSDADISRQAMDTIARYNALRGGLPDAQKLADKFRVTMDESLKWLEEFQSTGKELKMDEPATHKEKPAPVKIDIKPAVEEKSVKRIDVHKIMNALVDSGSLWFAVIIDLILNGIGFYIIGPEPIMKVGMVCVSVIVVLFSVRAWIKRDKLLWAMFALVASFMDISFILLATDVQTANSSSDTELIRLTDLANKSEVYLESLQSMQLEKGQGYAQQIKDAVSSRDKASSDLQNYRLAPKTEKQAVQMTASKVFTAIPDAVMSGKWDRWIASGLMLLVFTGLQLTIISSTGVKWNGKNQTQYQGE